MDALSRTNSRESTRSASHVLSSAAAVPPSSRKARHSDVDTTHGDVAASISMPPPSTKPSHHRYRTSSSRRSSRISEPLLAPPPPSSGIANSYHAGDLMPPAEPDDIAASLEAIRKGPGADSGIPSAIRRSEPDLESNRMSFSSLYGSKSAMASGPSSVGGSDQDGQRHLDVLGEAVTDEGDAARPQDDRATTATQALSVTTQSQNGALSPSLASSLRETYDNGLGNSPGSASSSAPTQPSQPPSRQGRTVRGRTPVASRRVSASIASTSHSAERSVASTNSPNKIGTIGICALDSKARSKPSRNILNRMVGKDNEFEVIIFGDKVILDEQVENWPVCDFLISFFSDGFPLEKAIAYAKLRRPFCVNDLPMQTVLWDRRMCLMILDRMGVPTPERLEVSRDGGPVALSTDIAARMKQLTGVELVGSEDGRGGGQAPPQDVHMEDDDDTLVVDGRKLRKPFVEKPTSGEDHNINIYYPKSQGGGGRRLFRKINNKSSEKDDGLVVPKAITEPEGSYVYEQFLKVKDAEDVKAYTVGYDFCHAETRKSPVVDGVVKRNPNGKEIRYVTKLSEVEQVMASKIARGFGQRVCGFDLLRVGEGPQRQSFVIDVNGWSFVKDNNDYYNNCAQILKAMFIRERMKWEGRATPSELGDTEPRGSLPPVSAPDESKSRRLTVGKDKDPTNAVHRGALSSVFRSRSISQLRDSVHHAAQWVGHPHAAKSPSGTSSPITSPPTLERPDPPRSRPQTVPNLADDHVLPPPAVTSLADHLKAEEDGRRISADLVSIAHSEAPSTIPAPAAKSQWKLKGMVAVIRHADRTPKQKFKFTFHAKPFVDLLKGHQEEVLLVGEAALRSVQQAVQQAMAEGTEDMKKLRSLQNALAKKGNWPGTKVQIKPMFKKPKDDKAKEKAQQENKERRASVPMADSTDPSDVDGSQDKPTADETKKLKGFSGEDDPTGPTQQRAAHRSDSVGEITMSRAAAADQNLVLDKLQLVMKWGGEPTHSARYQATDLGENMRNDLLLMNRRVLDDVSIFTSSERRVTTSAQIFAAAFLDEQEVADDQIHVRKDLLDDSNAAKDEMDKVKKQLKGLLREGQSAPEQFAWPKDGTPEPYLVVRRVVELMKFHRRVMRHNFTKLQSSEAVSSLEKIQKSPGRASLGTDPSALANGAKSPAPSTMGGLESSTDAQASVIQSRWCTGEDAELFKERWEKLFNEFTDAEKVDPSKISELYDTMKFDALHNRQFLEWVFTPSGSILAEDDDLEGSSRLKRTESQNAREEFEHTHAGQASAGTPSSTSANGPNGATGELLNMDNLQLPPPRRTDTASTSASNTEASTDSLRQRKHGEAKPTFSQRLGFRRKSQDLKAVARSMGVAPPLGSNDDPSRSYFNLYQGTASSVQSKVKNDVRLEKLNEMYSLSKILFDFIGPQEYGITDSEKLEIGLLTSLPLLKEIVKDLEEVQASDDAKSFIYFTKESHIYTLLNCILEGGVQTKIARNAIPELDYLSQICFELYESEDPDACNLNDPQAPFNYSIRITISPGCHTYDPLDVQLDSKHCIGCAPRRSLTSHGDWKEVLETLRAKFQMVKLPRSFTAVDLSERHPQAFLQDLPNNGDGETDEVGQGDDADQAQEREEKMLQDIEMLRREGESSSQIAPAH